LYCPSIEDYPVFEKTHQGLGMPYGLRRLSDSEHQRLISWLEHGAPMREEDSLSDEEQAQIAGWEMFLNGDANKQQLMSRYIYEHLFASDIYFDATTRRFFELVRSRSAPGQAIDLIASRRPYDDPGVERPYYRLRLRKETAVAKRLRPYLWNKVRMARYRELFLADNYQVKRLPGYDFDTASNPFHSFVDIPVPARYQFLLDDAAHFVDGFIKGPVCRGQVALNVIRDRFWVFFVNPDHHINLDDSQFLAREIPNLRLPVESNEIAAYNPVNWLKYSRSQKKFQKAKMEFLNRELPDQQDVNLSLIWDGDGWNKNAALTVYRHFDSATVVQGLKGSPPKTAWIISYSLFERIHYLLVAGFDVYGNVGHQLFTRLYMDFLRMDGESNFLALLPIKQREQERDDWYREDVDLIAEYLSDEDGHYLRETGIQYQTATPKLELYDKLSRYLGEIISDRKQTALSKPLWQQQLFMAPGQSIAYLPELTYLIVHHDNNMMDAKSWKVYSLIHDVAHKTVSHLLSEEDSLQPSDDQLNVEPGILGAYPNALFFVNQRDLGQFAQQLASVNSEAGYRALFNAYAVLPQAENFWQISDQLHRYFASTKPLAWGVLDYSRLYNNRGLSQ